MSLSVTETAGDYVSDNESEVTPPPLLISEPEATTVYSPKKPGRKRKSQPAVTPVDPNISTSRQSKRIRKPPTKDADIYDFYDTFRANCKLRRMKQEAVEVEEKEPVEETNEEAEASAAKPLKGNNSFKENEEIVMKSSPKSPKDLALSKTSNQSLPTLSPEEYDAPRTSTSSPRTKFPIVRGVPASSAYQSGVKTLGGFHVTTPQALANVLPAYQDKRSKGNRDIQPVTCPDCNITLKNQFSYNTHRNYVHGQIIRANITCPEPACEVKSTNMVALVRHLNTHHRYRLRHETLVFDDQEQFDDWFKDLTEDGSINFVRSSGSKPGTGLNDCISLMYYCQKSRKRDVSIPESKISPACPAYFRLTKYPSGKIALYAQLTHVGHTCHAKLKAIDTYAPLSTALANIAREQEQITALGKVKIAAEYSFENNSLVNSCLDLLTNITRDLKRARTLLSGIVPNDLTCEEALDESISVDPESDMYGAGAGVDDDLDSGYAYPEEETEAVQLLNGTPGYSSYPSPPKLQAEQRANLEKFDEQRIKEYKQLPIVLSNGRVQCGLCKVILKNFESYNVHRDNQHGLHTVRSTAHFPPPSHLTSLPPFNHGNGFNRYQLCDVCNVDFQRTHTNQVMVCHHCNVYFHRACNNGHLAVCNSMRYRY